MLDRFLCIILRYRLALQDRTAECNEASLLKHSRVEVSLDDVSHSTYAEGNESRCDFFIEKKLHILKMEEVCRSWCFVKGIDVSNEGTRNGLSVG